MHSTNMTEMQPYRIPATQEKAMKLEMDENTLIARNVRNIAAAIAATIMFGMASAHALSWHEANINARAAELKVTPMGLQLSQNERDKAMFETMPRGK
jgi:hypothetical protein